MNTKRIFITGAILALIYIVLEGVIHGYFLHDLYDQTASIWRAKDEMQSMYWIIFLAEAFFAFVFGYIYAYGYEANKSGLGQGVRFGLLIALLFAPTNSAMWYVILPVPAMLAVYWAVFGFITLVLLGIVAGLVYKN